MFYQQKFLILFFHDTTNTIRLLLLLPRAANLQNEKTFSTTRRNPLFSPYKPLWCCYQGVSFTTLIGYSINEITSLGFLLYICVGGSDTIMHTPSPHGKVQIDTGRIFFSHAMRKFVGKSVAAENAASWKTPKRERSSSTKTAHKREKYFRSTWSVIKEL